jgi:hypothetical protein
MKITITPEEIIKRCLWDTYVYYVVGSEKEAERMLKENIEIEEVKLSSSAFDARFDNTLSSVFEFKQKNLRINGINTNSKLHYTNPTRQTKPFDVFSNQFYV